MEDTTETAPPHLVDVLAREIQLPRTQVGNALRLLDDDNTVPFIARYRKEVTGSMDEVVLRQLRDRAAYLRELEERRATVLESIESQGKLDEPLKARILAAATKQVLEDLYLPYKPKRRTRAMIAREKGLEPLATSIFLGRLPDGEADALIAEFLAGSDAGLDEQGAWAGCRDILAETVADDADTRAHLRDRTWDAGRIVSETTREYEGRKTKFSDYAQFEELLKRIPPHRYLAIRRGETEKVLRVKVAAPEEELLDWLAAHWAEGARGRLAEQWRLALADAYQRLIAPSIEVELRVRLKEEADEASITVFGENLSQLLLQPPGGQRVVLGLDPGFRTGSKWVVVDGTGRLLEHGTIYPLPPRNEPGQAAKTILQAVQKHKVTVVAVGNGTAARELLAFVRTTLKNAAQELRGSIAAVLVNEAGASVYSASDMAREEFPDLDITVRGAVSIARRWQDPLAELVKIDPKSIGVGQYQHDVAQGRLRTALDETVESCVNKVGVNLNTASWALLRYVAGIGPAQSREIVIQRDTRGPFRMREELTQVPRMGPKAFQQCAGFLRIPSAPNPLDASAVHPEHYPLVERMAADLGVPLSELVGQGDRIDAIDPKAYVTGEVGLPTLNDILAELRKPGRDPREPVDAVEFDENVTEIGHLSPGMRLDGVVTNITHFGAFVDLGVHQDGLAHVSQLADRFVKHPTDVVRVGQAVKVTVLEVDTARGRIALSLKSRPPVDAQGNPAPPPAKSSPGEKSPDAARDKNLDAARDKNDKNPVKAEDGPQDRKRKPRVRRRPPGDRPQESAGSTDKATLDDVMQRFQPGKDS